MENQATIHPSQYNCYGERKEHEEKPQSLEDKATDILLETLLECGVSCDLSRAEIKKRMGIILKDVQIKPSVNSVSKK